jgi:hypothetical protein
MRSDWQPFVGVYGSIVTLNFGRTRLNFMVDKARHLIEDWQDANIIHNVSGHQQTTHASHMGLLLPLSSSSNADRDVQWQRPAPGRLKCSIDPSFL